MSITTLEAATSNTESNLQRPAPAARRYWMFSLAVILLPALFLLSSIPIVRSASFPSEAGDPFLLNPDYAFSLKQANCDTVVFGDSTAVTGIDPTVVEKTTSLKTCNIAQSQSILAITGTKALDTYLQNNTPPKQIVIQLAPETFAHDRQDFFWPEGLTMLLRRDFGVRALLTMIEHPQQSYGFALWAIKARLGSFRSHPDFASTQALFREHRGLLVLPKPSEKACEKNWNFYPPTSAWIQGLREKYSVNGTKVIINVSPVPDCTHNYTQVASSLSKLTDNTLPLYPIGLFSDLDRHLTLAGAERSSTELGQQILSLDRNNK